MKNMQSNPLMSLTAALAVLAGSAGTVIAGETTTPPALVAKVIQLPSANSPVQSITVWVPGAATKTASQAAAAATDTARVIVLPAVNGPLQCVTVWTPGVEKRL